MSDPLAVLFSEFVNERIVLHNVTRHADVVLDRVEGVSGVPVTS